jgi:phospholipid/cholesterol/gamma-HCH transport system substrate-binding protein
VRLAIRKHFRSFLAVIGLIVVAAAVAVYILNEQGLRFPVVEKSQKQIEIELENAQAVEPGQGQSVRVAGVEVGRISGVEVQNGVAVVKIDLESDYDDLIREDATALLRPKTALKDMFIEVNPGTGRVVPDGGTIPVANTLPDVDPDEIYAALDADTRPYLKLLISGAGKGLRGRGADLREVFRRLEPVHRDLARVTRATAARRVELKRLVHRYGLLMAEVGRRPGELRRLVSASHAVFGALAGESGDISTSPPRAPSRRCATSHRCCAARSSPCARRSASCRRRTPRSRRS